jgi:hypothetical protein
VWLTVNDLLRWWPAEEVSKWQRGSEVKWNEMKTKHVFLKNLFLFFLGFG